MKKETCVINYNKEQRCWNIIIETAQQNDYLNLNSFAKSIKYGRDISKNKLLTLYIFNKKDELIEKTLYIKKYKQK